MLFNVLVLETRTGREGDAAVPSLHNSSIFHLQPTVISSSYISHCLVYFNELCPEVIVLLLRKASAVCCFLSVKLKVRLCLIIL